MVGVIGVLMRFDVWMSMKYCGFVNFSLQVRYSCKRLSRCFGWKVYSIGSTSPASPFPSVFHPLETIQHIFGRGGESGCLHSTECREVRSLLGPGLPRSHYFLLGVDYFLPV